MKQTSPHADRPKTDEISKAERFISSFIKAKSDILIYPPANPVVSESIEKALEALHGSFGDRSVVELHIEKDRLLVDGDAVGSNDPRVIKLSLALYRRGIRKLIIDPSIAFDEMKLLLDALNMKVEEIAEAGGIDVLIKGRGIEHAAVEETAELTIVDGANLPVADEMLPDLDGLDDFDVEIAGLESTEGFSRMFVRVEEGNPANVKRLRKLLANPEAFSGLLEKFALQIEKIEGEVDAGTRISRMLEILQTVGSAIASLPSEDERSQMLKSVAVSVLGLSASLRTELVNQGIMPNLALRGIESSILSKFPIVDLADAILENFQITGGTASVMASYLGNLDLDRTNKSELAENLHFSLKQSGKLTPEVEALLSSARKMKTDLDARKDESGAPKLGEPVNPREDFDLPRVEGYPPEKIQFKGTEKAELLSWILKEFEFPEANIVASTMLELLGHEKSPQNHASLVERVALYIDRFLSDRDYDRAAELIQGLQDERQRKGETFSAIQLKPLDEAIDKYVGEDGIRRLIGAFQGMNKESSDFSEVTEYFSTLGLPAINALLQSLEDEQSRHVRLLTCQALSQIGQKGLEAIAQKLDHPQWFVARNSVSILGQIGTADCVHYLQKALSHPEARVRREALKGLASVRNEEAIDLICACADGHDSEICKTALDWIAVIKSEQALPMLQELLGGGAMWKRDDEIVRSAIEALGEIETEPALALLEKLAQTRRRLFRRRRAAFIRETASAALSKIGGKKNR